MKDIGELKNIKVEFASPNLPRVGFVYYLIVKEKCYFLGAEKSAETIVQEILRKEQNDVSALEFFELQTHSGYPKKPPGSLEVRKILFKRPWWFRSFWGGQPELEAQSVETTELPEGVRKTFASHIGETDPAFSCWTPESARKAGYNPTDLGAETIPPLLSYIYHKKRENPNGLQSFIVVDYGEGIEGKERPGKYRFCIWQKIASRE